MRETDIRDLASGYESIVRHAQNEKVIITREGKPVAVILGIENRDRENFERDSSEEFWRMIEARRAEPLVSWAEAKDKLTNTAES